MIGAIIGDIAGSRFEFDRSPKTVDGYEIFDDGCCFTDDTVMTVGVAEAYCGVPEELKEKALTYLPEDLKAVPDIYRLSASRSSGRAVSAIGSPVRADQ